MKPLAFRQPEKQKVIIMKSILSLFLCFIPTLALAQKQGELVMYEVPQILISHDYQCSLGWKINATQIGSSRTQLAIQRKPKKKVVEIIQMVRIMQHPSGDSEFVGWDAMNREWTWEEQYGNEAILGYRDRQNRLFHIACETRDKTARRTE